jgi:hypothetical protein
MTASKPSAAALAAEWDPRPGDAVMPKRGVHKGQIGMLHMPWGPPAGYCRVQFGSDGPWQVYKLRNLIPATKAEIKAQGKDGVGGLRGFDAPR